jgi:DNA-binding beta-propeller fold protein YncE
VTDSFNDRVEKFNNDGAYLTQWGTFGSGNGQFNYPHGIDVDPSGNVYVVDTDNDRVQKFSDTGAFLVAWGSTGTGDGQFQSPYGVAATTGGIVFVTDFDNDRVEKFAADVVAVEPTTWGSLKQRFLGSGTR